MNAQQFLDSMTETANRLDLEGHMNLVSREVSVFGVPGFEVIGYQDWYNQCQYEFEHRLLKQVSYQGLNVLAEMPGKVMFKTVETVEASDGQVNTHGVEFIIQLEEDGAWRVGQQRILPEEELENDRRRGVL